MILTSERIMRIFEVIAALWCLLMWVVSAGVSLYRQEPGDIPFGLLAILCAAMCAHWLYVVSTRPERHKSLTSEEQQVADAYQRTRHKYRHALCNLSESITVKKTTALTNATETCAWWLMGEPQYLDDPVHGIISATCWLRQLYRGWLLQRKPCR